MNPWLIAQIVLDFLLLTALIVCFSHLKKHKKLLEDTRIKDLFDLRSSLGELLRESLDISNKISAEVENQRSLAEDVFKEFDKEKNMLFKQVQELKSEAKDLREELNRYDATTGKIIKDKYFETIKLAETGLNAEEISKRTNIPLGEIELALSLRR